MPTIVMTGGHAGIGRVAARTLAERFGCDLILTGRNRDRLETAAETLRQDTKVRIDVVELDLASLASVRTGAEACRRLLRGRTGDDRQLHGVLCNAGVQSHGAVSYSSDGHEETFATNCLGHFLLVALLLDTVAPTGRIVWTTSGTHDPATMDGRSVGAAIEPDALSLAAQGRTSKAISGGRRYATSKLCILLYASEQDRRLRQAGKTIGSIAYDPGFLPETGMGLMAPAVLRSALAKSLLKALGITMGRMPFSGEALAALAADPTLSGMSGRYFQSKDGKLGEARSSSASYNLACASKLWDDSERMVFEAVLPSRQDVDAS